MTFQQISLAVETAERGSISAAAAHLRISQPNASQAIKKLEDELGYSIFRRVGGGVAPTEKGYAFLEHAAAIISENQAIKAISGEEYVPRLKVGVTNFSPAVKAFMKFCEENRNAPSADLLCLNVSGSESNRLLRERAIDITVTVLFKETYPIAVQLCRENNFIMKSLAQLPLCVKVRKDHPLLVSGVLDGSAKGFQQLAQYPYVEYRQVEQVINTYKRTPIVSYGCSYCIFVDDVDTRLQLLAKTDAYCVAIGLDDGKKEKFGLEYIPIPKEFGTLTTVVRKGDENLPGISRYTELLKETIAQNA